MRHLLIPLILALCGVAQASAPVAPVERYLARALPNSGAPGVAYALVEGGAIRSGARGEVLRGSGEAVTPDTPFLLGSISKSITALAVMQLVEAGKITLGAPVARYLSAFEQSPARRVTVRQLLSHTSGYSTRQGNDRYRDGDDGAQALAQQVDRIAAWRPAHAPGTTWAYSNANYLVLGALIEAVSGQEYARYVANNILRPIGMRDSFVADGTAHDEVARGHRPWFFTRRAIAAEPLHRITAPAGGVVASANDTARFLATMVNGRNDVLSAAGKAAMLRPASEIAPHYGLGWFLDAEQGIAFHTGSVPGVETLAVLVPARRKGAVVLANGGSGFGFGVTTPLREGVAARALGLPYTEPGTPWSARLLYLSVLLAPLIFVACIGWAVTHRAGLRSKTGFSGRFSLWFPLGMMLALAGCFLWLIPQLFGVSIGTLGRFQPDFALCLVAGAVTGLAWALVRLGIAYGGVRRAG